MIDGHILKTPILIRTCHKKCISCEYPVADYSYTYCHAHALDGPDFEGYHMYCN